MRVLGEEGQGEGGGEGETGMRRQNWDLHLAIDRGLVLGRFDGFEGVGVAIESV